MSELSEPLILYKIASSSRVLSPKASKASKLLKGFVSHSRLIPSQSHCLERDSRTLKARLIAALVSEASIASLYRQGLKSEMRCLLTFLPTVVVKGGTTKGFSWKSAFLAVLADAGRLETNNFSWCSPDGKSSLKVSRKSCAKLSSRTR